MARSDLCPGCAGSACLLWNSGDTAVLRGSASSGSAWGYGDKAEAQQPGQKLWGAQLHLSEGASCLNLGDALHASSHWHTDICRPSSKSPRSRPQEGQHGGGTARGCRSGDRQRGQTEEPRCGVCPDPSTLCPSPVRCFTPHFVVLWQGNEAWGPRSSSCRRAGWLQAGKKTTRVKINGSRLAAG